MKNKIIPYSSLRSERKPLRDMLPFSMPIAMYIDPTNYCNFHCLFCPRSLPEYRQYVNKYLHFDLAVFERIIKEIILYGRLKVLRLYYLGEPFLHPKILEMISLAVKHNVAERIEITSNGSVMNKEHAEGICSIAKNKNTLLYFRFSIYSVNSENHIRITNSKFNIESIYQNIKYFKKCRDNDEVNNIFIYAKMLDTYSEENNVFIERYNSIVDEAVIETPMNWSGFDDINLLSNAYRSTPSTNKYGSVSLLRKVCAYPFYSLCINPDGTVVACCVDWSRKTFLGNINDQSLYEIWNGSMANELRELHLCGERTKNEACKNCQILHSLPVEDDIDSLSIEKWNELRGYRNK
jgi:radical SAM protein with 4Fe4S-binding SPASM domain